jgi:nucleotide-binding universal stress UspA family protein
MSDHRVLKVLVPVDLGHSSEAALRYAQMLVSRLDAQLTVMYVNDALTLQSYDQIYTGYRDLPVEQEVMMEDAVRSYARPQLGSVPFDVLVVADDTPRAVATAADRHDMSLIVTGTHGRHGWKRLVDGSISESILHATERPVISVPQDAEFGSVSNILCPVNFTDAARRGARAACWTARALGAKLNVLHVIEVEIAHSALSGVKDAIRDWIEPVLEGECEIRQVMTSHGVAAERILEYADDIRAQTLVLGAKHEGRSHARSTMGTTVEKILHHAKLPVMSVVDPWTLGRPEIGHAA